MLFQVLDLKCFRSTGLKWWIVKYTAMEISNAINHNVKLQITQWMGFKYNAVFHSYSLEHSEVTESR